MNARKLITTPIAAGLRLLGYHIAPYVPAGAIPRDYDPKTISDILAARPYTMTPVPRLVALCNATRYVIENQIPGDIVECGVWKGGSMMTVARTLVRAGHTEKHLYLFDTFEGMSEPTAADVMWDGKDARVLWEQNRNPDQTNNFCLGPLDGVKKVMHETGYDKEKIHFVKGKVEETLPGQAPAAISLLRLDTDWYESTKHELVHLFPRLSRGGIIIFDDYGFWQGAKKAVDEYLKENQISLFLHRIDEESRIAVKL